MIKTILKGKKWRLFLHYPTLRGWVSKWQVVYIYDYDDEHNDVFNLGYVNDKEFNAYAFIVFGFGLSLETYKGTR